MKRFCLATLCVLVSGVVLSACSDSEGVGSGKPTLSLKAPGAIAFSPMKSELYDGRFATFSVIVSGFLDNAAANNVELESVLVDDPSWLSLQLEGSSFANGSKTFVIHASYLGSAFAEAPATLQLSLKDIPKGYEYSEGTRSIHAVVGDGRKAHPLPVSQANIQAFSNHANTAEGRSLHYLLTEDIVLPPPPKNQSNWTAIGSAAAPFNGSLDGKGHTLSGLTLHAPEANNQALFGVTGETAFIENLGLVGGSVKGNHMVGGLVGLNGGTVRNSYATGDVTGSENRIGGLVGANAGTVQDCYVTGKVIGNAYVGGVVGQSDGEIVNSYATGNVEGNSNVGGLVGVNFTNATVRNSHATGSVTGSDRNVGGLVGLNMPDATVRNSHATGNVTGGDNNVGGVVGLSLGGTVQDCYATGNVTGSGESVGGVVGSSNTAVTVRDCYATGSVTGGGDDVGGVVGSNFISTVQGCYATGNVTGSGKNVGGVVGSSSPNATVRSSHATGHVEGDSAVGGVAGLNGGMMQSNYATGNVVGSQSYVGGVVGRNMSDGMVQNSYAMGSVTGGQFYVGGVVGYNTGTVQNSYATGSVTGSRDYVGGVVGGGGDGTVQNSYATGNVSGQSYVGGILGMSHSKTLQNCVALSSSVRQTFVNNNIGRVLGNTLGDPSTLRNNYARSSMVLTYDNNQTLTPVNGLNLKDGQATAEHNSESFWRALSWDFSTVWEWRSGSLPILRGVGGTQNPRVQ